MLFTSAAVMQFYTVLAESQQKTDRANLIK